MKIIIWPDKHGTRYYDASTLEAWDRSSIAILKELTREPYGYMLPQRYEPHITLDVRDIDFRARIARQEQEYEAAKKQYELALKYIEAGESPVYTSPNGRHSWPKSWRLLELRSDYEYERYELVNVITHD